MPGAGVVPFGAHFCLLHAGRGDLADALVPYFAAGLARGEACLWVTADPLSPADARAALAAVVPDLAERERGGQVEFLDAAELRANGRTGSDAVATWLEREERARARGFDALRVATDAPWFERDGASTFADHESAIDAAFRGRRIVAVCSYDLSACAPHDVVDAVRHHRFAVARRDGQWQVIESGRGAHGDVPPSPGEPDPRKDEFLAMLGHELRNPLSPILTALQLLEIQGDFRREHEVIERQARHLARLVDDLLDVARIARGQLELRRRRAELSTLVARGIELASPLLEKQRHRLIRDVPAQGLETHVDPLRIAQVIGNLLTNAAKYTPAGGRITLTGRRDGAHVVLSVSDDGPGIPPEVLPSMFEPFAQLHQPLDRAHGGLGLGLALVRSLVQAHGGSVTAESAPEGGATFTVRLPLAVDGASSPAPSDDLRLVLPPPSRRVLVVEDNPDAAFMLAQALRLVGHRVEVAHDGPQALDAAAAFQPQVAVVDIGLPAMDGYELARRLRQRPGGAELRLIALTGYGQESDRRLSEEVGFERHLVKPVDLRLLRALIEDELLPA